MDVGDLPNHVKYCVSVLSLRWATIRTPPVRAWGVGIPQQHQPHGFIDADKPHYICKLHQSLYGLKQAPRAWYQTLSRGLHSLGFTQSKADPSLFIYQHGCNIAYCLVYVDDLILAGNNSTKLDNIIQSLGHQFNLKDLGHLHYFLGVEVIPTSTGLFLSQHSYIRDLLSRYKLDGAKPTHTPLSTFETLQLYDGSVATDSIIFRSVIGALQYLSLTRPDISFHVNRLAQFMHKLIHSHWSAVKRLLRYLKGTLHHGLHLRSSSSLSLTAYSDVD